jgi:hypothetical protein
MLNIIKNLKNKIQKLELKLNQAATYQDSSNFDCPLCKNYTDLIPEHYCSLHKHIGELERKYNQTIQQHKLEIQQKEETIETIMQIANESRKTVDNLMIAVMSKPFNLTTKQTEILGALASESEIKIQSLIKKILEYNKRLIKFNYFEEINKKY